MTDILIDLAIGGTVLALLLWRLLGVPLTGRHAAGGRHREPKRHPGYETTRLPLAEVTEPTERGAA